MLAWNLLSSLDFEHVFGGKLSQIILSKDLQKQPSTVDLYNSYSENFH